jgi:tetratricopeptide (TPR) repeat protein
MRGGQVPPRPGGDRAKDLVDRAGVHRRRREFLEADRTMRAALALARTEGDRRAEGVALGHLGISARRRRRYAAAVPLLTDAVEIHRALGSHQMIDCARALGEALLELGRSAEAVAPVREALALTRDPERRAQLTALLALLEAPDPAP